LIDEFDSREEVHAWTVRRGLDRLNANDCESEAFEVDRSIR
jgi:hypothetical protein